MLYMSSPDLFIGDLPKTESCRRQNKEIPGIRFSIGVAHTSTDIMACISI